MQIKDKNAVVTIDASGDVPMSTLHEIQRMLLVLDLRKVGYTGEFGRKLPLVLPPTVLGFYLLLMLGPEGGIGRLVMAAGGRPLAFTFTGLVIGSFIYSLPFVVQPLQDAFAAVGRRPLEVAATLRAGPVDRFFSVTIPLARAGFFSAAVLGFAHTLGEFGVVLMIGGNIPGETQVVSIAVYDHVESLEYAHAHWLSAALLVLSFLLLVSVYALNRRLRVVRA